MYLRFGHEAAGDECQVSGWADVEGLTALNRSLTNVGRWPSAVSHAFIFNDRFGHLAGRRELLLCGVELGNPKVAGGEHPLWVSKSRTLGKLRWPLVISYDDLKLQTACSKADDQYGHPSQNAGELNSFQL